MIELDGELINTVSIEAELATEEVLDACVGVVHEIETGDHAKLTNRDQPNQHPIEAITGLPETLAKNGDKSYVHVQSRGQEDRHHVRPREAGRRGPRFGQCRREGRRERQRREYGHRRKRICR